jgi:hypothetical protein
MLLIFQGINVRIEGHCEVHVFLAVSTAEISDISSSARTLCKRGSEPVAQAMGQVHHRTVSIKKHGRRWNGSRCLRRLRLAGQADSDRGRSSASGRGPSKPRGHQCAYLLRQEYYTSRFIKLSYLLRTKSLSAFRTRPQWARTARYSRPDLSQRWRLPKRGLFWTFCGPG